MPQQHCSSTSQIHSLDQHLLLSFQPLDVGFGIQYFTHRRLDSRPYILPNWFSHARQSSKRDFSSRKEE